MIFGWIIDLRLSNNLIMQQYTIDRYISRNIDIWEQPLPCEQCLWKLINWSSEWVSIWVDVNHLSLSYRGKRKNRKDWTDILLVCRNCHEDYHNHIKDLSQYSDDVIIEKCYELNEKYLEIASEMITIYQELRYKEKLWRLVELLSSNKK